MGRKPLWSLPVTYAAVGATQTQEALAFPPAGLRPFEKRVRIGTGPARWEFAWRATLSWGIKIRSGFEIELTETPPEVREGSYSPVGFDESGTPVEPATVEDEPAEVAYGPDGLPFVQPGDSVWLILAVGPFRFREPVRVIYVIDEPNRKGFAYGTLPGHPLSGEELFLVDLDDDGAVWLTLRSLSQPASTRWRLAAPLLSLAQRMLRRRYFAALTGPVD
ncbi:DUF1990 domain-containing protein [Salinibacterium sp. SYSU T00001]|uniref:DUF1990 family protein n=1 Tax=Homoserinimonas sedimenticola TaxID=2986805 RepID=UPI002236BD75|nr:DUF1990 domain-containing protein [Salinibacterium sedimenticola]MCW4384600.1 DUF1990 domain-containing protein [Salinibacterium sedimenticola]